jgi:uroporphyrinogen decarboxylase
MTESQWNNLKEAIAGKTTRQDLVAFIIDSPWLPGFNGISTLEYYSSGEKWFQANVKAIETFPDIIFLPGFWSEFGMCTEPSAFGSKCIWHQSNLPHAERIISDISDIHNIKKPDPRTDGLLPFVSQRLMEFRPRIQKMGHEIRFAIARGPLNIASFLMGTTEFMMATVMNPEEAHKLLSVITDFTIDWLQYQKKLFPEIDGIFILDDIVGFVGDAECKAFVVPYLSEIFHAFESSIRFFHNDAAGLVSSPYLEKIGVNLFNFSHEHTIKEISELTGPNIALLGNLPPRDVLAAGNPDDVKTAVQAMIRSADDITNVIWSCGGGIPPNVPSENIHTFYNTIVNLS